MDSNQRGCYAEYLFSIECLKRNIVVSFPVLDSCVYDCIADNGKNIYRIQVKYSGKGFLKHRKRDQQKKEWCEKNDIKYVELPYSESEEEWRDRLLK